MPQWDINSSKDFQFSNGSVISLNINNQIITIKILMAIKCSKFFNPYCWRRKKTNWNKIVAKSYTGIYRYFDTGLAIIKQILFSYNENLLGLEGQFGWVRPWTGLTLPELTQICWFCHSQWTPSQLSLQPSSGSCVFSLLLFVQTFELIDLLCLEYR